MPTGIDPQTQTMIDSMPEKTGKSLEGWYGVLKASGLEKHAALMKLLKATHGVTHGYANTIVLLYRQRLEGVPAEGDLVAAQFAGAKAGMRPIYETILKSVKKFGKDVEVAPKKTYVSLRRGKQFAIVKASTKDRVDLGLNLKGVEPAGRLEADTVFGGMCSHRVRLQSPGDVDKQVIGWLRQAYQAA